MSLTYYDPQSRYRNRLWARASGFLVSAFIMIVSMSIGYYAGTQGAARETIYLKAQVESITSERDALQAEVTKLRSDARTTSVRFEEIQKNFSEMIPQGTARDLIGLVTKQLSEGMSAERLAYLIRSGRPPRNCTEPETRRFIVSTPAYTGAESKAVLADGAIHVKGSGASARNEKGGEEAWYDPGKSISLEFTKKDGTSETKKGTMPLYHTVVVDNREFRFTVAAGAQSFAKVTFDSCDYP
jgi:hypothetical protein